MTTISIQAARAHLRVTNGEDGALITQKLEAAEDFVAAFIGRPIPTTTVTDESGEDTTTVPPGIQEAILQQLAFLYDGTPVDLGGLLAPFREWRF